MTEAKATKLEKVRKKMEKERAEMVTKRKAEADEKNKKVMEAMRKKVEEKAELVKKAVAAAVEEAKAAWEFEAVEREREGFRVGWFRGQKRLAARAGRMAVGMVYSGGAMMVAQ